MVDMLDAAPALGAPVLLTGKMEDYPDVVERIAERWPLLGMTPQAMRLARDPAMLPSIKPLPPSRRELIKPRRGFGIRMRRLGEVVDADHHVQPFVEGVSIAAVFRGERLLGVTEQLVSRFAYRGSVGPLDIDTAEIERIGALVAWRCGIQLDGLFGIDMIRDHYGDVWPIEINPRYTASMEIIERCGGGIMGKRIIFAPRDFIAPDLYDVYDPDEVADVPRVGEPIAEGHPICTIFAHGATVEDCKTALGERVERIRMPAAI
jgi:predicted ATP-grasp superfamily ATP-dependent carboligase